MPGRSPESLRKAKNFSSVVAVELTEELHSKGFKHVEGKEGVHPETYKIFVNFINYCDMLTAGYRVKC